MLVGLKLEIHVKVYQCFKPDRLEVFQRNKRFVWFAGSFQANNSNQAFKLISSTKPLKRWKLKQKSAYLSV